MPLDRIFQGLFFFSPLPSKFDCNHVSICDPYATCSLEPNNAYPWLHDVIPLKDFICCSAFAVIKPIFGTVYKLVLFTGDPYKDSTMMFFLPLNFFSLELSVALLKRPLSTKKALLCLL